MDAPRPTRSRAYVPVAPKNHEGDVEASPVHLEEQLGGWVRFRAAKILDPQALAIRPRRTSGSLYQGPGKEAAFMRPAGITHQRLFLSHCGALKAKPRQSTQRGGASNASNSDIGSPAERPSHIDEAPAPGRGCLDFAKPCSVQRL
jgi:hypothetical protein